MNSRPAAAGSGTARAQPPDLARLNAALDDFEVLELVGSGAMGWVDRAHQKRLDRPVAIKVLAGTADGDPELPARLKREAQMLARLDHPNIVTVHDFGERDGFCYLVMEFVEGVTLAELIRQRRVTPALALSIVPQICDALQFAHERGVVHRDIKPGNILMRADGRIKVADFGLVKIVERNDDDLLLTFANQYVGTPLYMAPEQIENPLVCIRPGLYSSPPPRSPHRKSFPVNGLPNHCHAASQPRGGSLRILGKGFVKLSVQYHNVFTCTANQPDCMNTPMSPSLRSVAGILVVTLAATVTVLAQTDQPDVEKPIIELAPLAAEGLNVQFVSQGDLPLYVNRGANRVLDILPANQTLTVLAMDRFGLQVRGRGKNGPLTGWIGQKRAFAHDTKQLTALKTFFERQLEIEELVRKQTPAIGMSLAELKRILGKPTTHAVSAAADGTTESLAWVIKQPVDLNAALQLGTDEELLKMEVEVGRVEVELIAGLAKSINRVVDGGADAIPTVIPPVRDPFGPAPKGETLAGQ